LNKRLRLYLFFFTGHPMPLNRFAGENSGGRVSLQQRLGLHLLLFTGQPVLLNQAAEWTAQFLLFARPGPVVEGSHNPLQMAITLHLPNLRRQVLALGCQQARVVQPANLSFDGPAIRNCQNLANRLDSSHPPGFGAIFFTRSSL
jgi:hypothetical protein